MLSLLLVSVVEAFPGHLTSSITTKGVGIGRCSTGWCDQRIQFHYSCYSSSSSSSSSYSRKKSSLSMNRCDEYANNVLKQPRWGGPIIGPIVRYFNSVFIGISFSIILRIMNSFKAFRRHLLVNQIFNRERGRGLLTVSNHMSVMDDPGLFAALIPWWRISPRRLRWVLCTEDVFFAVGNSCLFYPYLHLLISIFYMCCLFFHVCVCRTNTYK